MSNRKQLLLLLAALLLALLGAWLIPLPDHSGPGIEPTAVPR